MPEKTMLAFRLAGVPDLGSRGADILAILDAAASIEELKLPGLRLHELTGDRKGVRSITVTANWRVTFRFAKGNAFEVDLVDYH